MRGRAACRYGRISFFFSLVVGGVLGSSSYSGMPTPDKRARALTRLSVSEKVGVSHKSSSFSPLFFLLSRGISFKCFDVPSWIRLVTRAAEWPRRRDLQAGQK